MLGRTLLGINFMLLNHTLGVTSHQDRRAYFPVDMNATIQYLGRLSVPFDVKGQR